MNECTFPSIKARSGDCFAISGRESLAPAIDLDQLFTRCMGNVSFALTLLGELEATGMEHVEEISQHVANRNSADAAEAAHALKGAAGILCAENIRSLAAEIEAGGKTGDVVSFTSLVEKLRQEMGRCLAQIPHIRQQHAAS